MYRQSLIGRQRHKQKCSKTVKEIDGQIYIKIQIGKR